MRCPLERDDKASKEASAIDPEKTVDRGISGSFSVSTRIIVGYCEAWHACNNVFSMAISNV